MGPPHPVPVLWIRTLFFLPPPSVSPDPELAGHTIFVLFYGNVADPCHFDADPAFHLSAVPNLTSYFHADPDPAFYADPGSAPE